MGLKMTKNLPLIVILGSTGTGKTKLSLELAKKFGGEIIGADSMQIYRQLDIASAKATKEEQLIAPHHMIDILEPHEKFTVLEYRNKAIPIIENLLTNNKLPIIVGGTNYYIESLLWKILVHDINEKVEKNVLLLPLNYYELSSEELHQKLATVDTTMARRLHPSNKRKIIRSLEVYYSKGRRHSDIIDEQQSTKGGSKSGGGLRYNNACILWMRCDQDILNKRLNDRVDNMISQGLLDELSYFHKLYNEQRIKQNRTADYTKGIFQSIGFKEFHDYLILTEDEKASETGQKILRESVDRLKLVTRRYARKQIKWTVNRFLGRTDREVPPIFGLDTSDVSNWNSDVSEPAVKIVNSFITGDPCDIQPLPKGDVISVSNATDDTFTCEVCNRVFVGDKQWQVHLNSNKHKKIKNKKSMLKEQSVS
ncbi:hypothetical protein GWI33_020626 [Rhynchophorus ferrugineus]|uniref:C2H2-type domain-containing protein n=1 Tax=Rhynchophorus ferrugineus TaxID=354439 RepID=A0A834HRH6_RHYFE|nr:hypothetical protein GWI33_020626 [Rhynchophorus ferrugineus]